MADDTRFKVTEKVDSHLHQLQQLSTTTHEQLQEMIQNQDAQCKLLQKLSTTSHEQQQTIMNLKKATEEYQTRMDQSMTQIGEWVRALSQKSDRLFNFGEAPILAMGDDTRWQAMEERRRRNETQSKSLQQLVASLQWGIQDSAKRQTATIRKIDNLTGGETTETEEFADKNQEIKSLLDPDVDSTDRDDEPRLTGEIAITMALGQETQRVACGSKVEASTEEKVSVEEGVLGEGLETAWVGEIADKRQEIEGISKDLRCPIQCGASRAEGLPHPSNPEHEGSLEDLQMVSDESEVNLKPCGSMKCNYALNELDELVNLLIELMELRLANSRKGGRIDSLANSMGFLEIYFAHKVFVKMPEKGVHVLAGLRVDEWPSNLVSLGIKLDHNARNRPYDRGKRFFYNANGNVQMLVVRRAEIWFEISELQSLPIDRGGVFDDSISYMSAASVEIGGKSFVFDPGGCISHRCLDDVQDMGYGNEVFGVILDLKCVKNGLKSLLLDRGAASNSVKAHLNEHGA